MNCTICGKPVVLIPSATDRASKFGGKPADYTKLFTAHSQCLIDQYRQDTAQLILRHY